MADKVVLTDVSKLRPDLLEKSQAELERQMAEIQMAIAYKAEEGARKEREARHAEAVKHVEAIWSGLQFLNEHGFLSDAVREFFTYAKGAFTPHLKLRKPSG